MLIKVKGSKWDAVRGFINLWLKDKTLYCNYCGKTFVKTEFPCCENPQVGRNIDHTRGVIKQNKELQKTRRNEFASNESNTMRLAASLPPRLYLDLDKAFKDQYNIRLFDNKTDLHEFAREFPMFCIPRKV